MIAPSGRPVLLVGVIAMMLLVTACHRPPTPTAAPPGPTGTTSPPPATTSAGPVQPTVTGPACTTAGALAGWTVTRLAEQTVVIPVSETNVAAITGEIADGAGGVILFGSSAPADLGSSLRQLAARAPGGIAPLVMTDEEGGDVQRMANLVGVLPSARQMAATMTADQIQQLALRTGQRMKANGVTMDLAPVLDLDDRAGPSDANPDGTRSFSRTAAVARADGIAFARGLESAGVVPVVKHFPGLGYATGNTDVRKASTLPWSTLRQDGLLPFAAAVRAGVPAVMIANALVPGLTTRPASVSPEVIRTVLREQLGFSGLVLTDSLSGTAIQAAGYTVPSATVAALAAGADMILFTSTTVATLTRQIVQAVVSAVSSGTLTRSRLTEAVTHILTTKQVDLCRP